MFKVTDEQRNRMVLVGKILLILGIILIFILVVVPYVSAACPYSGGGSFAVGATHMSSPVIVGEVPKLPHEFGGLVLIRNKAAPRGTVVTAVGEGTQCTPAVTDCTGKFGYGTFDSKLIVMGKRVGGVYVNPREGTPLSFYVNGKRAWVYANGQWSQEFPYRSGGYDRLIFYVQ